MMYIFHVQNTHVYIVKISNKQIFAKQNLLGNVKPDQKENLFAQGALKASACWKKRNVFIFLSFSCESGIFPM